jgi:hypothetical protein
MLLGGSFRRLLPDCAFLSVDLPLYFEFKSFLPVFNVANTFEEAEFSPLCLFSFFGFLVKLALQILEFH